MNRAQRIAAQLGMPQGTANHKLRKQLLYQYVCVANHHFCYKCGSEIESVDEFSIEHKLPWEGRDTELFWDLSNIAFSHHQCNRPHKTGAAKLVIHSPEGMSWCGKCKQHLPVTLFRKRKDSVSGYEYRCNTCCNDAQQKRRAEGKR